MSPIISRRVEREDSEEIIEARLSALYSVFFMTISCLIQLSFLVSGANLAHLIELNDIEQLVPF